MLADLQNGGIVGCAQKLSKILNKLFQIVRNKRFCVSLKEPCKKSFQQNFFYGLENGMLDAMYFWNSADH